MRRALIVMLLLALAGGVATFAQSGDDYAWRQERFYVNIGGFLTSVNTEARLDSTYYGKGATLNFEKDLGLDDSQTVYRLDAGWRMTDRQQLLFTWYEINRDSSKTLTHDAVWGDYTFLAGSRAKASWDSTFYQVYYRFAFVQAPKGEFGGTVGVSYLDQSAHLEGWATLRSQGSSQAYYRKVSKSLNAPIPVIGLFGLYQFTPKFRMNGDIQYLKIKISGVDGQYTDARLNFEYFPWENVGFGAGWYYDEYEVWSSNPDWRGSFTYDFNGPVVYVSFKF